MSWSFFFKLLLLFWKEKKTSNKSKSCTQCMKLPFPDAPLWCSQLLIYFFIFTFLAMTLCGDTLLCNFPKCRIKLSGFAWVTACSHVFCDQHGSGEFSRSPAICPACSSALSGKMDIVRTELTPSEDYKAMVLAGLRPDIVLDISARALAFWTYQVNDLLSAALFSHTN